MKNLLILVDKIGKKKELFSELISERISKENIKLTLARFSDLSLEIDNKNISIKLYDQDIKDFDLVYFRRVGDVYFSLAGTLAICLNYLKIPFYDTTFAEVGPDEDKLTSLTRLCLAGLPTIPTYFCWPTHIIENKKHIIQKLGFPLVAKSLGSHRGEGVYLLKTEEDFKKLPLNEEKQFLFQKFVENDEEYRLLVLKDRVAVAEKKIRTDPNEFRNNVAIGAREEFLKVSDVPENFKEIAVRGAKTLKIQTAGADVMIDKKTGEPWLLEVNRGPGLTYDTKISPEIDELAKFFIRELKNTDDSN